MKITEFNKPEAEPTPEPTFEDELRAEFETFGEEKVPVKAAPAPKEVDALEEEIRTQFEASYEGNIGAMEVMQFYKTAAKDQIDLLTKLIAADQHKKAWQLIQNVTDTELVGQEFREGVGLIRKGSNVTPDVGEAQTRIEAAKLGFKTTDDGIPPLLTTNGKNKVHENVMESPTADLKHLARAAAKRYSAGQGTDKNPHPADSYHGKIWQQTFNKARAKLPEPELQEEALTEARRDQIILVDFQPAYNTGSYDYDEALANAMAYINKKQPQVIAFYNGQDVGIEDTQDEVMWHFIEDGGLDEELTHLFKFKEKSYAWLRQWMDEGVDPADIIKVIRFLVVNKLNDSREIEDDDWLALVGEDFEYYNDREMNIYLPDINIGHLKALSGSLMGGGGAHECLKELELLMNAMNIKYKKVPQWIYGG